MGSQIAGRPLVIPTANGNVTATPTPAGKVNLELNGKNEIIEMAEFKEFLLANAPKVKQGDSVSFSGEKGIAPMPEDKDPVKQAAKSGNTLLKLLGLAVATGVAIWQRKNIMKYGTQLLEKLGVLKSKSFINGIDKNGNVLKIRKINPKNLTYVPDSGIVNMQPYASIVGKKLI